MDDEGVNSILSNGCNPLDPEWCVQRAVGPDPQP